MKIRCLLGHKWRLVPKFRERKTGRPSPYRACLRCGKYQYDYVLWISSAESGRFGIGPQWEGQSPPKGYDSWKDYFSRMRKARKSFTTKSSVVGKSRYEI